MTTLAPQTQEELRKALRQHGFKPWDHSPNTAVAEKAFELGAKDERARVATALERILVTHVIWPQESADAIYALLNELRSP